MRIHSTTIIIIFSCLFLAITQLSCKKLISIPGPKNTVTTTELFNTSAQAETAMAGVYTRMINGDHQNPSVGGTKTWSAGAVRLFTGFSSGELYNGYGASTIEYYVFSTNKLTLFNSTPSFEIWKTAYITVYGVNSIIEGIAASTSPALSVTTRKELTAEAKFIRAFTYFYLVNLFGDVPLALTVDFNKTVNMPRTPQDQVYRQIIEDLKEAQTTLRPDYSLTPDERVRPNKWAATAMLARVYLYLKEYEKAATEATALINEQGLFGLEADLNNIFKPVSREAIWQMKPFAEHSQVKNATPEGYVTIPTPLHQGFAPFCLSKQLLDAFEPGDKRRVDWVDSTNNQDDNMVGGTITFYPTKYKIGQSNGEIGTPGEYYMMLRLAEIFLIRAEAAANGAGAGIAGAIDDLNSIRWRAGLLKLPATLTKEQVLTAIEKERQVELFAEWGHRWFDLKRTNRASAVLQTIPIKLPWEGDHQLLYPIPVEEIRSNSFLIQNPGYF